MVKRKESRTGPVVSMGMKILLLLFPFFLGVIGFKQYNSEYGYLDAAYASLQMYLMSVSPDISLEAGYNVFIEAGRWLAPAVTLVVGLGLIVELVCGNLWPRFWAKFRSHYLVYGDHEWVGKLCGEEIGPFSRYIIMDKEKYIRGCNYILIFNSDMKNMDFYTNMILPSAAKHNVKVYMNLLEMERQDIQGEGLITFQLNEYIASSFFKNRKWIDFEKKLIEEKNGSIIKIAIIGFEDFGQKMFQSALLLNLISINQKIEYHIWGNVRSYCEKHWELNDEHLAPDKAVFHEDSWGSSLKFLEDFDVILLCGSQEENLVVLSDLLRFTSFAGRSGRIYVNVENPEILTMFQIKHESVKYKKNESKSVFAVDERLFTIEIPEKEHLLDSIIANNLSMYERAEQKHQIYAEKARKKEAANENPEYQYSDWIELNSYLRWDNVSSANYDDIRRYLKKNGAADEELAELEHYRWIRSHYLDNWEYSEKRNDRLHQHSDLMPYVNLPEEEKKKNML